MKSISKLGYFDLSMIVVSLVIGMGIFRTPVNVAHDALTPSIFFFAWIFGGLIALCGALTFAEIGSRLPVNGGYFRIFSKCYHPAFAFMLNGTILVSNAASVAGVALIGAEYSSQFIFSGHYSSEQNQTHHLLIAFIEILLFLALNLLGLKTSATTQNILTIFKLTLVIIIISAVFIPNETSKSVFVLPEIFHSTTDYLKSFGLCLIPVSFAYGGYQQTINFGGEINNAAKILPKAIITGILLVIGLYITINFAYYKVIGFENLKSAESIASIMATKIFGDLGSKILTLMLFFSVLAYVNVGLMANPRVICAMSEDGNLPKFFSKHSKKFNVPVTALVTFTIVTIITLLYAGTFDKLLKGIIFIDSIGFIAAASTIFILRKKQGPRIGEIYRIKLFPWIPLLFIAGYAFVTYSIVSDNWKSALAGTFVFLGFLPLYFVFYWWNKRQTN